MALSDATRDRIQSIIDSDNVVLFMKGTKLMPQCGFSATCISILNDIGVGYTTFDVLADPEVRDGIKAYANWPTIPQLYAAGEFQGGCDIVKEMFGKGELHAALGADPPAAVDAKIEVSAAALTSLKAAADDADEPYLRLEIDARFNHNLYFGAKKPTDVVVDVGGLSIVVDPMTSAKADGLCIDFQEGPDGTGFKIDNPNAPPQVKQLTAKELKQKLDAGDAVELFDVRSAEERNIAKIDAARPLDDAGTQHLEGLPKDSLLVFHCHLGGRSQAAAEHFLAQGFTNVHNLVGGIAAWSADVDSSVATY